MMVIAPLVTAQEDNDLNTNLGGIAENDGSIKDKKPILFNKDKYSLNLRYEIVGDDTYKILFCAKKTGKKKPPLIPLLNDGFQLKSDDKNVIINNDKIKIIGSQWDYVSGKYLTEGTIYVEYNGEVVSSFTFEVSPFSNRMTRNGEDLDIVVAEVFPDFPIDLCLVFDKKKSKAMLYRLPLIISTSGEDGKDGKNGSNGYNGSHGMYKIVNISSNTILAIAQNAEAIANPASPHRLYTTAGNNGGNGCDGENGKDGQDGGDINITISDDGIEDKLIIITDGGKGGKGGKGGIGGKGGYGTYRGRDGIDGSNGHDGNDGFDGDINMNVVDNTDDEIMRLMSSYTFFTSNCLDNMRTGEADDTNILLAEAKTRYDAVFRVKNGFALVKKDNKYGFIDCRGNEVVRPMFTNIHQNSNFDWLNESGGKYQPIYTVEGHGKNRSIRWIGLDGQISRTYTNYQFNITETIPDAVWDF